MILYEMDGVSGVMLLNAQKEPVLWIRMLCGARKLVCLFCKVPNKAGLERVLYRRKAAGRTAFPFIS